MAITFEDSLFKKDQGLQTKRRAVWEERRSRDVRFAPSAWERRSLAKGKTVNSREQPSAHVHTGIPDLQAAGPASFQDQSETMLTRCRMQGRQLLQNPQSAFPRAALFALPLSQGFDERCGNRK
jgi:hypothetical protein